MGPLAICRLRDAMESFVNDAKDRGGKVVTGGSRHGNQGFFYQPTVIRMWPDLQDHDGEAVRAGRSDCAIQDL